MPKPTMSKRDQEGFVSFLVRIPRSVMTEIEWRFLEPAENIVKAKIGEMLEEYGWDYEESETQALDMTEVREIKSPVRLAITGFYRLLMDAALGRGIKERVLSAILDQYRQETKLMAKAKAFISSYAHKGDRSNAKAQSGAGLDTDKPTVHDR